MTISAMHVSYAWKAARFLCVAALPFALAVGFFLISATPSDAQSRAQICRQLNSQLASLGRSSTRGGNPAKYRQYGNAIRKQGNQINRAKRALRRNACVGSIGRSRSTCRSINASLQKMQANLSNLKKQRARFAPRQVGNAGDRQRIQAALRRNRCGVQQANAQPEKKSRRRTLLEQVFGVRTYNDRGNREDGETGVDGSLAARFGTYRTLCVRKTDGYYFPISFSTVPDRFDTDEDTCRAMCPSSDVALYYHRMPSEDSEDMISYRTETPYAQEPFAFAYRKSIDPEYRCRFSTAGITQSVDAAATGEVETKPKQIRIGVPNFRKDPTLPPDVYDTEQIGFSAEKAIAYLKAVESSSDDEQPELLAVDRKVRIVGPAFFPVQ